MDDASRGGCICELTFYEKDDKAPRSAGQSAKESNRVSFSNRTSGREAALKDDDDDEEVVAVGGSGRGSCRGSKGSARESARHERKSITGGGSISAPPEMVTGGAKSSSLDDWRLSGRDGLPTGVPAQEPSDGRVIAQIDRHGRVNDLSGAPSPTSAAKPAAAKSGKAPKVASRNNRWSDDGGDGDSDARGSRRRRRRSFS